MTKDWFRIIALAFLMVSSKQLIAHVEDGFQCSSAKESKTKIKLRYNPQEISNEQCNLGVEIKVAPENNGPQIRELSTKQNFKVEKAENEILWQNVQEAESYFVVNSKNGSFVQKQLGSEGDKRFQFYLHAPDAQTQKVVVELPAPDFSKNRNKFSTKAEVYLHPLESRHAAYMGNIQIECERI